MDDLISRKAAIERIEKQKYREPSIGVWKQNDRVALVCYDTVIEALKRLPSAQPKHGKWIPCTKTGMIASELVLAQGGKWYGFKCSECRFIYKGNALTESIYCQCCGARMDG